MSYDIVTRLFLELYFLTEKVLSYDVVRFKFIREYDVNVLLRICDPKSITFYREDSRHLGTCFTENTGRNTVCKFSLD